MFSVSVLSLAVLAALYLEHFARPFLGLPAGAAPVVMLAALAINAGVAILALTYRRRGPAVALATTALALVQVAAVLATA